MRTQRLLLAVLTGLAVGWAILLVAAPLGLAREPRSAWLRTSALTYGVGALICHQRTDRSFHTGSVRWPVCARCTGLYLGGACGLLLGAFAGHGPRLRRLTRNSRRRRALLVMTAAPTLVTVATGAAGLWEPSNLWRAALAWPLAAVAGALTAAVLREDDGFRRMRLR